VTVQDPVPVPEVPTVKLPLVPEVEPVAAPEQLTLAELALLVVQLKVLVLPDVVLALAMDELAVGRACTVKEELLEAHAPAAL
jgi:hypothetical protein